MNRRPPPVRQSLQDLTVVTLISAILISGCSTSQSVSLYQPIVQMNVDGANAALDSGGEPNEMIGGETALNVALEKRSESIAQLLLARGADPNRMGNTGRPAISFLAPQVEEAKTRIDLGVLFSSPNFGPPGLIDIAGFGAVDAAKFRANYICARELTPSTVSTLLSRTNNVNATYYPSQVTALIEAAACGYVETMRELIRAGALPTATTAAGDTALSFAAAAGRPDAMKLLLDTGIDVNTKGSGGRTPIMLAASGTLPDYITTVKALLGHGANVNATTAEGDTALINAARIEGNVAMVELLISAGAHREAKNSRGETALSVSKGAVRQVLAGSAQ